MEKQQSFTDIEYSNRKRTTRRDEFLAIMNELIPWDEWVQIIVPYYPSGKRGRPTRGIETMLRMYLLQSWFNLSDEGVEDAIYDSYAMRKFMGIDFISNEQVPDATTLCKFRKLLNDNGIGKLFFDTINYHLKKHGRMLSGGTIVDATIVEAPTSTKNERKSRDPEMHSTKKGNNWHFGAKLHIGVDAATGFVHSLEVTPANVHDVVAAANLIREDDEVVYGDAAYLGLEQRDEIKNDPHKSRINYRINNRVHKLKKYDNSPAHFWFCFMEKQKSRVRAKVEYPFRVIKRIFGFTKLRYKGLTKNRNYAFVLFAGANAYMCAISGGFERSLSAIG